MNEELLIKLVQKYPELYDLEDARYHDEQRRINVWEEISGIMEQTPNACKEKWKKIRENFRKAMNLRKTKSGQGAKNFKPIRYSKELSFVTPYMRSESESLTNLPPVTIEDDDEQSNITSPPSTPGSSTISATTESSRSVTKKMKTGDTQSSTQTLFQSYLEKKYCHNRQEEEDPIISFFKNLGQTVKQFPPDLRVRVKREVFNIVSEAEEEFIQRNDTTVQSTFPNSSIYRNNTEDPVVIRQIFFSRDDTQPATVLISSPSQLPGPSSTYIPQSRLINTQKSISSAPFFFIKSQITSQPDSKNQLTEFLSFAKKK